MNNTNLLSIAVCLILTVSSAIASASEGQTNAQAERHFKKANELFKLAEYDAAIAEYKEVINLSASGRIAQNAQYWIGQSHFRAGQFDAAQATFAKLIEVYPTSAIVPVTKLMVERVGQARENEKIRRAMSDAADKGFVIDPDTGVRYTKIVALAGKNDVIKNTGGLNLSPNGKFLLCDNLVVPLDGSEPFDLMHTAAYGGTWSPDGRKAAFYSGDAICVVPVSPETGRPTGSVRKLLDGNYKNGPRVSWSPDSEKLVFSRMPDKEKKIHGGNIWILSVKDGSLTQITIDPDAKEEAPAWSPDGKTIAYTMKKAPYRGRYSFCLISAKSGKPRNIIDSLKKRTAVRFPPSWTWTPDGKWILYKLGREMHLLNVNDNRKLDIASPSRDVVGDFFAWSPDGKKMFFYRGSYGYRFGLNLVSASGGPPLDLGRARSFYQAMGFYGALAWSDNRKLIALGDGDNEEGIVFWIISLSGDDPVPLEMDVSFKGKTLPLAVSPNAKKLAFVVGRDDGTEDLFVVPISLQEARTTGSAVKVFEGWSKGVGYNAAVNWSPDCTKLAVIHKNDLWIAPTNGDKPIQITKTPEMELYPAWSPDGKMVNYAIYFDLGKSHAGLYVVPASGGKATKILSVPSRNRAWAPDSKGLTVVSSGLISTIPIAGGETQQIAKLKNLGLDSVSSLRWSPDAKYIACVGNQIEKDHSGSIFVIPADGGKATMLTTDDGSSKHSLSWSPDGRWITYASEGPVKVRPEGAIWEADFEEIVKKASR